MVNRIVLLEHVEKAEKFLEKVCKDEASYPESPVTEALVKMNLEHSRRVRKNASVIADGTENKNMLELAAVLHDVAKLDHRDAFSGGIDTFHHHYRGAAIAKKFLLQDLQIDKRMANVMFKMIDRHSCIPFISRFWLANYKENIPAPVTWLEIALRDADTLDQLEISGIHKIVHFRQIQGGIFYKEDDGDIQKAIVSARTSFEEAASVITTPTGNKLAALLKETAERFFSAVASVKSLQEFDATYELISKAAQK